MYSGLSCWREAIFVALVLTAILNLWISTMAVNTVTGNRAQAMMKWNAGGRTGLPARPLARPIFVVGFPKVGTTSIHAMFTCGGFKSSHYCCCGSNRSHTHCHGEGGDGRTFSECMRANKKAGRPILEGCGDYEVYAQMDAELGSSIYLPQHFDLDLLHAYSANATFLLNLRPANAWTKSVTRWYGLGGRFLTRFKVDIHKVNRNKALEEIFDNHTALIRDFVRKNPSHSLVEVDISNPSAGDTLSRAFGVPSFCWALHNKNKQTIIHGK